MYDGETSISNLTSKSFSCDVCKKSYKTKSSLNIHKRIHSGEKTYKCDVCDKGFSRKDHLTRHIVMIRVY